MRLTKHHLCCKLQSKDALRIGGSTDVSAGVNRKVCAGMNDGLKAGDMLVIVVGNCRLIVKKTVPSFSVATPYGSKAADR